MVARILVLSCCLLMVAQLNAAPKIQQWSTANGAQVLFVPAMDLPMVDIQVVFDAGAARDAEQSGLALLTNGLMSEGTKKWDSNQIAERFEGVGANQGNSSHRDMSVFSLRSLTEKALLDVALETFASIINEPTFPQKALDRERKRLLVSLSQKKESPDALSSDAFYQAVYSGHVYENFPEGTEASVQQIKRDDLLKFYNKYYVAANAVIAIVGAVDKTQADAIVNQLVGQLQQGRKAEMIKPVDGLTQSQEVKIDFPSSQTHLLVGQPGVRRGDRDYYALYLGNHIFGGSGLVSKLSDEIREKRGLAYSSYSYFSPMRAEGPFIMGLQTKNSSAEEALKVMRDTLVEFVKNGPSEKELLAAKRNLTGGFALRIASNKSIVQNLAAIGFYELPLDYLDRYIENINAVSLAQIKDAYQRRVHPDKMVTIIVGGDNVAQAAKN
ncbi:MAG: insulinase family protein [Gammaproteobacteria bacterium]|nr:insulinase family protein [Gammaproteobacteria bacterium]